MILLQEMCPNRNFLLFTLIAIQAMAKFTRSFLKFSNSSQLKVKQGRFLHNVYTHNSGHSCWSSLGFIHNRVLERRGRQARIQKHLLSSKHFYFRSVIPVEDEEDPDPQEQKPVSDIAGMADARHKNNNSRAPYQNQMLIN